MRKNPSLNLKQIRGPEVESSCDPQTTTVTSYNNTL